MKRFLWVLLCLVSTSSSAYGGEKRIIELNDGTLLQGEIISMDGETCTVQTTTLGRISVKASTVRGIRMGGDAMDRGGSAALSGSDLKSQLGAIQRSMGSDPRLQGMAAQIQNDPRFHKLIQDPGVIAAAESGDYEALLVNEKLKAFVAETAPH